MKNYWKGCFRQSKLQNFLHLPTMMTDRIFRHIPTNCLEFEMIAKSGIIRSQWPLGFKMHFKCCNFISLQPLTVYMENSLKFEMSHLHQVTFIFLRPCERCYGSYLTSWNFTPKWNLKPVWVHFWSHVKMLLKFENSEANEHGYLKTNERSKL